MNSYRYRAFVNKNTEYQKQNEEKLHEFYDDVRGMLRLWDECGPQDKIEETLYRILYEDSGIFPVNRSHRLEDNIKKLKRASECKERHVCGNKNLCPVCLSFWRYGVAKVLQRAVQTNPKIRLVSRQETFLMPRGMYKSQYYQGALQPMIDRRLNPVYELPVGSKYSRYWVWKFLDNDGRASYKDDPDVLSDRYEGAFFDTWRAIGGLELVLSPFEMNNYPTWEISYQDKIRNSKITVHEMHKTNIKKGISDPVYNSIIVELQARMKRLDWLFRDSMGSVQRIMMVPSLLNESTIMIRLDSLFLDTRDHYNYVKEKYDELEDHKKFQSVTWPGKRPYERVWHPRQKSVMTCKPIPPNMLDILKIVESKFSTSCNLYPRLTTEEFPFFLNCFVDKQFTKKTGFFREEEE